MTDPDHIDRSLAKRAMGIPLLSSLEEQALGLRVRDSKGEDQQAVDALVEPHLRLVIANARNFRNYGLPLGDLTQEGILGLIHAARRFDPDRGVRFATYAQWWVRSFMTEYVLRNWSLIRLGTTRAQKALFFNMRRLRSQIDGVNGEAMPPATVQRIADILNVPATEVQAMEQRLAGRDPSLNAPSLDDSGEERGNLLISDGPSPEEGVIGNEQERIRRHLLSTALIHLPQRERDILEMRRLREPPMTLEEVGAVFGVSKERIRQIEHRAIAHLRSIILRHPTKGGDLF